MCVRLQIHITSPDTPQKPHATGATFETPPRSHNQRNKADQHSELGLPHFLALTVVRQ